MSNQRNAGIELYRVLMMLGVCLIHGFGVGAPRNVPSMKAIQSVLLCSVCGFVFISGYFGIRFKPIKVLRLCGIGLFGALVSSAGYALWGGAPLGRFGITSLLPSKTIGF